ncbi:MAG: hypothetical protein HDT32_06685 [Clostridiales bacterium]|nr:hypothetical protein [Clostridiales bacterium]
MNSKKKKIIAIVAVSLVVVLAAIFLALGLTIWRVKTDIDWVKAFSDSMIINQSQDNKKFEKTITIEQEDVKVSSFFQMVEIYNQYGRAIGHIVVDERYFNLDTTEFDTYDEYLFYDNRMYMYRKNGEDATHTDFTSTWEIFWEVFNENWGKNKYYFDNDIFEDMRIEHSEDAHILTATVSNDNCKAFFDGNDDAKDISEIGLVMSIDNDFKLINFKLKYRYKQTQDVTIEIVSKAPTEIEIRDFSDLIYD